MELEKTTLKVQGTNGAEQEIDAYRAPCGLYIHKATKNKSQWNVSHKCGMALPGGPFSRKQDAVAFVELIGPLTDWTADVATVASVEGLYKQVVELRNEHFEGQGPYEGAAPWRLKVSSEIELGGNKLQQAEEEPEDEAKPEAEEELVEEIDEPEAEEESEPQPLPTLAELFAEEANKEAELKERRGDKRKISDHLTVRVVKWPVDHEGLAHTTSPSDDHLVVVVERDNRVLCTFSAVDIELEDEQDGVLLYLDLDFGNEGKDGRWQNVGIAVQNGYVVYNTDWVYNLPKHEQGGKLYRDRELYPGHAKDLAELEQEEAEAEAEAVPA